MAIIGSVMLLAVLRIIGNDAEFILVSPIVLPFIKVRLLCYIIRTEQGKLRQSKEQTPAAS